MAVDCVQKFTEGSEVSILNSDVTVLGTSLNLFDGDFYKYTMNTIEDMSFTLRIIPQSPQPISVSFQLFKFDISGFTLAGTATLTQSQNTLNFGGVISDYYVCLHTNTGEINYELTASYSEQNFINFGRVDFYHGQTTAPVTIRNAPKVCLLNIFLELVDGELPLGLTLNPSGFVSGDTGCLDKMFNIPSSQLYDAVNNEPIGKSFIFTLRASIESDPSIFLDRQFELSVHNNWDIENNGLLNALPNLEQEIYSLDGSTITVEPDTIGTDLCPCPNPDAGKTTETPVYKLDLANYRISEYDERVKNELICDESGIQIEKLAPVYPNYPIIQINLPKSLCE